MQSLKKNVVLGLMALLIGSFAAASAQAQSGAMKAEVPFGFSVAKTDLEAGNYSIKVEGAFVAFTELGGSTTYALLSQRGTAPELNGHPYLVFTKYGTESFLNRIVFSSTNSYELPRSGREKEIMARRATGEQVAVLLEPR